MGRPTVSNRAVLFAVVVAFVTGMVSSLAIRPVHQSAELSTSVSSKEMAPNS